MLVAIVVVGVRIVSFDGGAALWRQGRVTRRFTRLDALGAFSALSDGLPV